MKLKPVVIALVVLLSLGGTGFTFFHYSVDDPTYKGERYSEWLHGTGKNRREALNAIGTDAVPFLLREFEAEDSALKVKLISALPPKVVNFIGFRPAKVRRGRAFCAFIRIVDEAEFAMPALCAMLDDNDQDVARRAASALGYMGKAAEPAIPLIENLLADADPVLEKQLQRSLGKIERAVRREP